MLRETRVVLYSLNDTCTTCIYCVFVPLTSIYKAYMWWTVTHITRWHVGGGQRNQWSEYGLLKLVVDNVQFSYVFYLSHVLVNSPVCVLIANNGLFWSGKTE